jgi:hypothetical protein
MKHLPFVALALLPIAVSAQEASPPHAICTTTTSTGLADNSADTRVVPNGTSLVDIIGDWLGNMLPNAGHIDTSIPSNDVSLFTEATTGSKKAKNVIRSVHPGAHIGTTYSTQHIEVRPVGSGVNGPRNSDIGQSISVIKKGWGENSAPAGEINGMYIVGRTSGPESAGGSTNSDMSAILADVQNRGKVGYANALEANISNVDRATFQYTRSVNVQAGVVNTLTDQQNSYGFVATANNGPNGTGIVVQTNNGATWDKFLSFSTAGIEKFYVSDTQAYAPRLKSTFASVRFEPQVAPPSAPVEGEVYWDATQKKLRVYTPDGWVNLH